MCGDNKAKPGDILIAFFNILIGSFAMGHAAPHFQTMAEGRGAAYTVFKTIDRVSQCEFYYYKHPSLKTIKFLISEV